MSRLLHMPRPRRLRTSAGRDDLRLSPEPGSTPTAGQMVRTAGADRLDTEPPGGKSVFPVYAGPLETPSSRGRELSGALPKGTRARRQSRTGHGRTRREGYPPRPPAYPPLSLRRSLKKGSRHSEAEANDDHKGSHRAADPGALLAGSRPSCQEASQKILLRCVVTARTRAKSGRLVGAVVSNSGKLAPVTIIRNSSAPFSQRLPSSVGIVAVPDERTPFSRQVVIWA